jgi:hypothetical protein
MGSLLVGDFSSKRLSFSRLRDLFRHEAALAPAAIIASGGFRRHPLEIRRVAAGEQINPDVGEVTDTATAQHSPSSLANEINWNVNICLHLFST